MVTHARTQAARFLGYEITTQHGDHILTRGRRSVNGTIRLRVPLDVVKAKCASYLSRGKPACRRQLKNSDDLTIVSTYGAEYRGLVQYYLLAGDVWRLGRVRWVMETSMLKTLAAKHRSTVATMAGKYKTTIQTPRGLRTCFQISVERQGRKPLVARFGEISLMRQKKAVLDDRSSVPPTVRKELISRLRAGRCELCDRRTTVDVHQVRKLADLVTTERPQPAWVQLMAKRRRKTLVVCQSCHDTIHARQPTATTTE